MSSPMPTLRLSDRLSGLRVVSALLVFTWAAAAVAQNNSHSNGNGLQTRWHSRPEAIRLAATLKQGGNVLFLRHATTDMLTTDQRPLEYMSDCTKQRNLSPAG